MEEFKSLSGLRTESGKTVDEADIHELLVAPDGSTAWGVIDKATADAAGVFAGEIWLDVEGLQHTAWGRHKHQILRAGYLSVEDFLFDVLQNYERIYQGTNESLLLMKPLEKDNALVAIEPVTGVNGVYLLQTGWIIRDRGLRKKKLLFARSESLAASPGPGEVSRTAPAEPGGTAPHALLKSNDLTIR